MLSPFEIEAMAGLPLLSGPALGTHRTPSAELEILRLRGLPLAWRKDRGSRQMVAFLAREEDQALLDELRGDILRWRVTQP